jgi:ribosomal protein S4
MRCAWKKSRSCALTTVLSEKQLLRYVKKARRAGGSTGQVLLQLLEMRLDNTVFRLGLWPDHSWLLASWSTTATSA